ncbi:MAG: tryptophanase, partial [Gemmatimonadetes bacterium]|nr:tryptophanase [Gemmatimonadota bacterium]
MPAAGWLAEPHKIKTVRLLAFPTLGERKKYLSDAHFNVFNLTPTQVTFDMCSHGTSAMSQDQLAGQVIGDEAYAGSRNFEALQEAIDGVFGHEYVCPTHNALGNIKLIASTLIPEGAVVPSNGRDRWDVLAPRGVQVVDVRDRAGPVFTGNVDLAALEELLAEGHVPVIDLQTFADGQHPFSLDNMSRVRRLADQYGVRLVLDASRIIENAWYIQCHEIGHGDRTIASLVRQMAKTGHILQLDGEQDPKCNTGGVLTTDHPGDYERFMNEVVVFEGLHTYGGMAGRTLEVFARGLREMCDEDEVRWVMHQTERFTDRLLEGGVPLERGCDGAYLKADEILPHVPETPRDTLSAALYLMAGVRAVAVHRTGAEGLVPVQIPRLAMTNEQLDQVADAIIALSAQAELVPPLQVVERGRWRDQMTYHWAYPDLPVVEFDTFPYAVHTVERVGSLTTGQRARAMRRAGYNTFLLDSADVTIDLLTDSGTTAMSHAQWAAYDAARASSTTSDEYHRLVAELQEVLGYAHIIPTHQGRAAEQILSEVMIRAGQVVPGNMYFTTTKLHQELAGGVFVDVICDEAHDPESEYPWKGDIDLEKLEAVVEKHGVDGVAYVSFEHSVNLAGGQPVSMDNMKDVYAYCSVLGIPVFFDATRLVENAYMIQAKDPRYDETPVEDIVREMLIYGDGCTVSGKKDFLINIGGLLAFKENADWAEKSRELLRVYEGNVTDGGLATADLAAIARGVREMLDDRYIRSRVRQTGYLGEL